MRLEDDVATYIGIHKTKRWLYISFRITIVLSLVKFLLFSQSVLYLDLLVGEEILVLDLVVEE